jgi:hypothetical protein
MTTETKTVAQIIEMARNYIRTKCSDDTGFKGAYIIGSINNMAPTDPFPDFRDIDIGVITDSVDDLHNEEENVNGYIVETVSSNPRYYSDPEAILSDARYANNIADGTILLDPACFLGPLQQKVKAEFAKRKWVRARWMREAEHVVENLNGMKQASSLGAFMLSFGRAVMYTTCTLTTCHLFPPTHRRGPIQLRNILHAAGDNELFEEYLAMAGVDQITPEQAKQFLADAIDAFDLAIEVYQTPIPYAYKLEPFIRPYLVEGTQDIFNDGGYRESIFWIARFYVIAAMVILNDGSPEQKKETAQRLGSFLHVLAIDTEEARLKRTDVCDAFHQKVRDYAESVTQNSDKIID